jgi:hypothetical protein
MHWICFMFFAVVRFCRKWPRFANNFSANLQFPTWLPQYFCLFSMESRELPLLFCHSFFLLLVKCVFGICCQFVCCCGRRCGKLWILFCSLIFDVNFIIRLIYVKPTLVNDFFWACDNLINLRLFPALLLPSKLLRKANHFFGWSWVDQNGCQGLTHVADCVAVTFGWTDCL